MSWITTLILFVYPFVLGLFIGILVSVKLDRLSGGSDYIDIDKLKFWKKKDKEDKKDDKVPESK